MTQDIWRRIGAVSGLAIGIILMNAMGYAGVLAGALFGAGGCVAGSLLAEQWYGIWNRNSEN